MMNGFVRFRHLLETLLKPLCRCFNKIVISPVWQIERIKPNTHTISDYV